MEQEIIHRLALIQLPGIGDLFAKLLTEYFNGAQNIFKSSKKELNSIPGIGKVLLNTLTNQSVLHNALVAAEAEFKFAKKHDIQILLYDEEAYPSRLKECDDSPFILFYKGQSVLNNAKILSVVGTRKATGYGQDLTEKIISEIKDENVLVVSGLAYGIDAYAHQFSLNYNLPTIGVLAHGLDKIYPAKHKPLAKKMLDKGGLLTEFFTGTNPDRENFPKRNRIVAGIADATLLVEAAEKGGALITANIANSYGREVFAVPGRTIDTYSRGCNKLIKANKAILVESGKELLRQMNWSAHQKPEKNTSQQLNLFADLSPEEAKIIDAIKNKGVLNKEQLAMVLNTKVQSVSAALFNLELNGLIRALPGNNFQIKG